MNFSMNGYQWRVRFVPKNSYELVDRTNTLRVATTDPKTLCVYLSDQLYGSFLRRVFIHELGHCAMWSYGLLDDIHRMVRPEYWIEVEEWICNFIADYGGKIYDIANQLGFGQNAMLLVPEEIEKFTRRS